MGRGGRYRTACLHSSSHNKRGSMGMTLSTKYTGAGAGGKGRQCRSRSVQALRAGMVNALGKSKKDLFPPANSCAAVGRPCGCWGWRKRHRHTHGSQGAPGGNQQEPSASLPRHQQPAHASRSPGHPPQCTHTHTTHTHTPEVLRSCASRSSAEPGFTKWDTSAMCTPTR